MSVAFYMYKLIVPNWIIDQCSISPQPIYCNVIITSIVYCDTKQLSYFHSFIVSSNFVLMDAPLWSSICLNLIIHLCKLQSLSIQWATITYMSCFERTSMYQLPASSLAHHTKHLLYSNMFFRIKPHTILRDCVSWMG